MHRNTLLSLGLALIAGLMFTLCACNGGSVIQDMADIEGVWDLHSDGNGYVSDFYSVSPIARHVTFDGVYSIYPNEILQKGYNWEWTYDGSRLQFEMLKDIPIEDSSCGNIHLQGTAKFDIPNISAAATTATGILTLENATVTCENDSDRTGSITGTFSVYMVRR